MDRRSDNAALYETDEPDRAWWACLLAAVGDLERSARRGRKISLPNLIRKFRRRWADAAATGASCEGPLAEAGAAILRRVYQYR